MGQCLLLLQLCSSTADHRQLRHDWLIPLGLQSETRRFPIPKIFSTAYILSSYSSSLTISNNETVLQLHTTRDVVFDSTFIRPTLTFLP